MASIGLPVIAPHASLAPGAECQNGAILLVSEWFPPSVGGSAELLANVYARVGSQPLQVLTSISPSTGGLAEPSNFRVARTPFGQGLGLFAPHAARARVHLARQVRKYSSANTVVHCGRALPEGTAAMIARRPFVCWTHGEELPIAAGSRELAWLMRRVHRAAGALFANSRNTAALLRDLGNPADRIHVVYPGVDATRFRPAAGGAIVRQAHLKSGELLLLSVGRLQSRKGHDLVLRALASPGRDVPPLRYLIVGDGPEKARLTALAADLGVSDRVDFVGTVSNTDLPGFYAAADIFVHPNRVDGSDFEGFGIVFLEAAAAGLPAIGGRSGGVPEAVEQDVTGLLVSGNDMEELRQAIRLLAASQPLRARLGAAARARVLADFTWERAAQLVSRVDSDLRASRR